MGSALNTTKSMAPDSHTRDSRVDRAALTVAFGEVGCTAGAAVMVQVLIQERADPTCRTVAATVKALRNGRHSQVCQMRGTLRKRVHTPPSVIPATQAAGRVTPQARSRRVAEAFSKAPMAQTLS